jgi:CheY-like chemotaxis protein
MALDDATCEVVVCDVGLNQLTCPEALELVKARGLDVPFILVSDAVDEHRSGEMMSAGAHDYLIKGNLARQAPVVRREIPSKLDGQPIAVDASIGITVAPEHGQDADTLLRCADMAMYQARGSGAGLAIYRRDQDRHRGYPEVPDGVVVALVQVHVYRAPALICYGGCRFVFAVAWTCRDLPFTGRIRRGESGE